MTKDYTWVWFAILIVVVIYGGQQGWFTKTINNEIIHQLENPVNPVGVHCSLKLDKTSLESGEQITGTISDGKITFCEVYGKYDGVWQKIFEGTTNLDGQLIGSEYINLVGDFEFMAVCGSGEDQCITNSVALTVNAVTDGGDDESDDFVLGCNDNDFTQTSFDDSIMFPGFCIDALGQHDDSCDAEGLLEEWSCPEGGDTADTCSATYLNCKSYLGDDAICYNGQCVIKECDVNIECSYIYGYGYVCRDNMCLEVTSGNCNEIVQDEGYEVGLWIPGGDYIDCNAQCEDYCTTGCASSSTGGTWGDCCGYTCN